MLPDSDAAIGHDHVNGPVCHVRISLRADDRAVRKPGVLKCVVDDFRNRVFECGGNARVQPLETLNCALGYSSRLMVGVRLLQRHEALTLGLRQKNQQPHRGCITSIRRHARGNGRRVIQPFQG